MIVPASPHIDTSKQSRNNDVGLRDRIVMELFTAVNGTLFWIFLDEWIRKILFPNSRVSCRFSYFFVLVIR